MTKLGNSINNLLLLSSIYDRKAGSLLRQAQTPFTLDDPFADPVKPSVSPSQPQGKIGLIPVPLQGLLRMNYGVKPPELENWAAHNETVLRQIQSFPWTDSIFNSVEAYKDGKKYQIIPENQRDPMQWDAIAILRPLGRIKTLMVCRSTGVPSDAVSPTIHTPQIGHFGFLVPALKKLSFFDGTALTQISEKFVQENLETLNRIRKQFEHEPRQLGPGGADGVAFAISPSKVFKIFRSRNAYQAAREAMARLWKNPQAAATEAMIYDAGEFNPIPIRINDQGAISSTYLYYYIIERMTPVHDIMGSHADIQKLELLLNVLRKATFPKDVPEIKSLQQLWQYGSQKDPEKLAQLKSGIRKFSRQLADKMKSEHGKIISEIEEAAHKYRENMLRADKKKDPQFASRSEPEQHKYELKPDWLVRLCREIIWKTLTNRRDLHGGNLGLTPYGEFRYFDPTYD